jgi:D-arabinose 1-dehydrogenase-like Zn-dependent alcohol dehydrogenase
MFLPEKGDLAARELDTKYTLRTPEASASTIVQLDVLFCGVCHSDLHQVRNEWPRPGRATGKKSG